MEEKTLEEENLGEEKLWKGEPWREYFADCRLQSLYERGIKSHLSLELILDLKSAPPPKLDLI